MGGLTLVGKVFLALGQYGGAILRRNALALLMVAIWLMALWILLSRRDLVVPLQFGHPLFPFLDLMISALFDFVKLALIGVMVKNTLPLLSRVLGSKTQSQSFLFRWVLISFLFELVLLAISAVQLQLEFGGTEPLSPTATIAVRLGSIYLQMIALWVAVCLYVAASRRRVDLVVATTIIYLVPASLITTLLLYAPVIAPFWFGLDQLAGPWNAMMQTVAVAGETVAALVYAVFFTVAIVCLAETKGAGSTEPAS